MMELAFVESVFLQPRYVTDNKYWRPFMKILRHSKKLYISIFVLFIFPAGANAGIINFSGQLDFIGLDRGTGVYSGTPLGTTFSGFIDDTTFSGEISDGTTLTPFGCCIAAGGLGVFDNLKLDADEVALLNGLKGFDMYSMGDILDVINIEGDVATTSGGRIEIGLSYLFDATTFSDENLNNYPFDPDEVQMALFFIAEEDFNGDDNYSAVGELNAVPLPGTLLLFGTGVFFIGIMKRKI
ncbi:MAG: PEP-CTERM sorting domain-containing protein [Candidatus Brocadiaceae bacterium]|nr:PEP-CTERM sorting domain-containing protein [Candidatus Brocadiaceae bacterium]